MKVIKPSLLVWGLSVLMDISFMTEGRPGVSADEDGLLRTLEGRRGRVEVLSKTFMIDRAYRAMEGPSSSRTVCLLQHEPPELLWMTGAWAEVVGPDGSAPASSEFMCHANVEFLDLRRHLALFGMGSKIRRPLFFNLSPGQLRIDLPEGFGIPILSNEPLSMTTQVLNQNIEQATVQVRHRVTMEFVRDHGLRGPIQPLFERSVYGLALLEGRDGYFGQGSTDRPKHSPGCPIGMDATYSRGVHVVRDAFGRTFTAQWVLKPGRHVNRTLVTEVLALPFDTTVHHITVHLHPFAESIELRNLTTGHTLFKSRARDFSDRIGIAYADHLSSVEGIPLYKDHEYELVTMYHNTTSEDQDAMGVMYLYLLDKEFQKPTLAFRE